MNSSPSKESGECRDPIIRLLGCKYDACGGGQDAEIQARARQGPRCAGETLRPADSRRSERAVPDDSVCELRVSRDGRLLHEGLRSAQAIRGNEAGRDSSRAQSEAVNVDAAWRNRAR